MKVTNKFSLPDPIFRAVSQVYPPKEGRLSVTDLINPPLIRYLKMKHWDELEEDASERLWALLGRAMDNILTLYAPSTWIKQLKLEYAFDGFVIVGKLDYFNPITRVLGDWKSTSVWSYLLGGRIEWEKQLNCYDWLLQNAADFPVQHLEVQRLLRDWQKSKTYDVDYPKIPFVSLKVKQWPLQEQESYIKERTAAYKAEPIECTPEEKWEKPTTYAVMKKGRKSALRVLDSEEKAENWKADKQGLEPKGSSNLSIVTRPGECTRCLSYCPVRKVCEFSKE